MSNAQQVILGTSAVVIWGRSPTPNPIQVINLDTVNTATLGFQSNINPGSSTAIPLGPGASMSFDGTQVVYGCASHSLSLLLVPGGTAYSPGTMNITGDVIATVTGDVEVTNTPAVTISGTPTVSIPGTVDISTPSPINVSAATVDIAAAAGYIPSGAVAQLLAITTQQTIALGGTYTTPIVSVGNVYTSYDLSYSAWCGSQATAGAALTLDCTITWYADAAGTIPLYWEDWYSWLGQNVITQAQPVFASGPMHGNYMSLTFTNYGGTSIFLNPIYVWGTSRDIAYGDWRQEVPTMSPGSGITTLPLTSQGSSNVLCALGFSCSASTTYFLPLPLYSGSIWVRFQTTEPMATNLILVTAADSVISGGIQAGVQANNVLWNPTDTNSGTQTAGHEYSALLISPRSPSFIVCSTKSTLPPSINLTVVGQQGV